MGDVRSDNAWASGASIGQGRRLHHELAGPPEGLSQEQIDENQKREAARVEAEQQAEDDALAKALGLGSDFVSKQATYRPLRVAFFAHQKELNGKESNAAKEKEIAARYKVAKKEFDEAQAALNEAEKEGLVGKASEGDVEAVRALLSKDGVDLNTRDSTGRRALTAALNSNKVKMVEFLLAQEGIDVNSTDASCPPLHHAANGGFSECAALLIKHKENGDKSECAAFLDQKHDDKSAMQVAQTYDSPGHADVVTKLKAAGATEFSSSCCVLS